MRFLGEYRMAFFTCAVIALISIYVGMYGIEFNKDIVGIIRFAKHSTGSQTGENKSLFEGGLIFSAKTTSEESDDSELLHYDYYRESCPGAERTIHRAMKERYEAKPSIAPNLIRLLFHDCFIEGCDASVLLDADETFASEKEAPPNLSLKGFDVIEAIKSELENLCPGVVSCADLLVLATKEAILLAGGPSYSLKTGRKDSLKAFKESSEKELISPKANLSTIRERFSARGFSVREVVSLLGAHSIGITHCTFFEDRVYNFSGTGKPDPKLDPAFRQELATKCPFTATSSAHLSSPASKVSSNYGVNSQNMKDPVIDMSFNCEGGKGNFGTRFFKRLLENKTLIFSDQQLLESKESKRWVTAYASNKRLFRQDFAKSMQKLSTSHVLTGSLGEVRRVCSKPLPRI